MKRSLTIMMAVCFLVLMFAGSSFALPFSGKIWTITDYGTGGGQNTTTALEIVPVSTPLATFTVDAINFDSRPGTMTYDQFLSNGGANNLVWDVSVPSSFKNSTILTDNTTASLFQFTGTANFPAVFSITHDDGIALYIDGQLFNAGEFPDIPLPTTFTLSDKSLSPGPHSFVLNYAAWNGFPEVLLAPDVKVPEPTTMLLLGAGLLGLAAFRRKKD